jgi:hypothetical protein
VHTLTPPALPGNATEQLLSNPDRGFRLEAYLNVATGQGMYQSADMDAFAAFHQALALHQTDRPTLAQTYFYLTDYKARPLDQIAFANMTRYLEMVAAAHMKVLLRFAYIWDDAHPLWQEPKLPQIIQHIQQLSRLFHQFAGTIHAVQAGFIGPWGEWHGDARQRTDETAILRTLLRSVPEEIQVQLRMYDMKTKNAPALSAVDQSRLGFHDDFLIGVPHEWNTGEDNDHAVAYQQYLRDTAHILQDGEMIWFWANPIYLKTPTIASQPFIQRLIDSHFTSLSLAHNYLEAQSGSFSAQELENELHNQGVKDYPGIPTTTSMLAWQYEPIDAETLTARHWPFQSAWFKDSQGQPLQRTVFDYIRDYLGYRLQVKKITWEPDVFASPVQVTLHNYGFAAPLGLATVELLVVDTNEQVLGRTTLAPDDLQAGIDVAAMIPMIPGDPPAQIGVRLAARNGDGGRLANIVDHFDGTNWFAIH